MLHLLAVGLASWRLASLLQRERGPFAIFEQLRVAIELRDGVPVEEQRIRYEVAQGLACWWCLSLWTSAACFALYRVSPAIVRIMAASTIAIVIERVLGDGED